MQYNEQLAQYGIFANNAKTDIKQDRINIIGNSTIIDSIDLNITQSKDIKFLDIRICEIKDIIFTKDITLDLYFAGVTFTNKIQSNSNFRGIFEFANCTFKETVNFNNANFNDVFIIYNTFNNDVSFSQTTFNQNIKFLDVTFEKKLILSRTEFNCDNAQFNITCNKEARFMGVNFKNAVFDKCNFKEDLNLVIEFNTIDIEHSNILGNLNFNASKGGMISISNSTIWKVTELAYTITNNIKLDNSTFKAKINITSHNFRNTNQVEFIKNTFGECVIQKGLFLKNVNFEECIFLEKLVLKDYVFNQITFNTCIFKDNVYFNNSRFENYANFNECEFEKTASFYGVAFDDTPNFSQAMFKGNLNIVNANLNFDFNNLESKIKQEYVNVNKKSIDKFANDFRDSFRAFKSALIKDNNILDASKFHKYELYCKEIELKQSWSKKGKNAKDRQDLIENSWIFRDAIDYLLLAFYRKLSDHHTDFIKTLNNLILLIALYSIFIFTAGYKIESNNKNDIILSKLNCILKDYKDAIINSPFIQEYYIEISISIISICFISVILLLLHIFKDIKLNFKIINNVVLEVFKTIYILGIYISLLLGILIYMNMFIPNEQDRPILNIGIFFIFCIFYLFSVCLKSLFLRYIIVCFSYIITIIAMGINIAILNPFIGKLINDSIKIEDTSFMYVTFAYSILTFLVLFSLQKTARKNSIVPN